MTAQENRVTTTVQEMYFDVCDLVNGETYKSLGYDTKKDFLLDLKEKLERVEILLKGE
jgi:hypothetical protein